LQKNKNKNPQPQNKTPQKKSKKTNPKKSYQLQECKAAAATSLERHKNPGSLWGGGGGGELGTNTHRLCKALKIISLDLRFFGLVILRQGSLWV